LEIRYDLQKNKENELLKIISSITNDSTLDSSLLLEDFKKNYLSITPPEEEPPLMQFLTIDSLKNYKSGQSIKAGNIMLNIKKLISTFPNVIAASVSISYDIPILKICAALAILKELCDIFTVDITREQAIVLVALWKNCDNAQHISLSDGFIAVNTLYQSLDDCVMNQTTYNRIIDQLISLQCIEVTDERIWLREYINIKYMD
jgi:hypothetical protein